MFYLLFLLLCPFIAAQTNPGARSLSLSNSDVVLAGDYFSIFSNPAGSGEISSVMIAADYSPAPFGLSELSHAAISLSLPFPFGVISSGIRSYGYDLYRETKFLLSYSLCLPEKISIGAAVNYQHVSIKNYGSDGSFFFSIGSTARLNRVIKFGFSLINLNNATLGNDEGQIPVILNSGFSFRFSDSFILHTAVEKDLRYKFSFSGGVEYTINGLLTLRSGITDQPVKYSGGLAVCYDQFTFDYGFSYHQELGFTHEVTIGFRLPEPEIHTSARRGPENAK